MKMRIKTTREWVTNTKPRPLRRGHSPEDTSARIAAVLDSLKQESFTVLADVKSKNSKTPDLMYEIRLGQNNAVYCTCKGWQHSKTGTCKHIEEFKTKVRRFKF